MCSSHSTIRLRPAMEARAGTNIYRPVGWHETPCLNHTDQAATHLHCCRARGRGICTRARLAARQKCLHVHQAVNRAIKCKLDTSWQAWLQQNRRRLTLHRCYGTSHNTAVDGRAGVRLVSALLHPQLRAAGLAQPLQPARGVGGPMLCVLQGCRVHPRGHLLCGAVRLRQLYHCVPARPLQPARHRECMGSKTSMLLSAVNWHHSRRPLTVTLQQTAW